MRFCRMSTLTDGDHELIAAANAVLEKHYRPFWHMVAAAIRSQDGRIWTGLHIGATVGRLSVCAEAVAFGRALMDGDGTIQTAVAVQASEAGGRRPRTGGRSAVRRLPGDDPGSCSAKR